MPVEETANILMLLSYIARATGSVADLSNYWKLIDIWGDYLVSALPDPGVIFPLVL